MLEVTALTVPLADGDLNVFFVLPVVTDSAILTLVRDHMRFMLVSSRTFAKYRPTVHGVAMQEDTFSAFIHSLA